MESYLIDWLALLGRWMHLIFGIAWIGASFYFIWLDNHLQPPADAALDQKGVGGEVWAVHGGGFYNAQKYRLAPPAIPDTLHWFYWEAYCTWLSGFFMLCVVYYAGADVYLIDRSVAALSPAAAIAIGIGTLVAGWVIYDRLCESPLAKRPAWLSAVLALLVCAAAYGLCHVFSGRGAFIHFGAMLGTIMVANVYFVIIPGQRAMVASASAGQKPDPVHGLRAKTRSVHNTYFTLPVLFTMISNHYAMTYGAGYNWLVLIALTVAGAAIRVYFVARHKAGSAASRWPLVTGIVVLAGVAFVLRPAAVTPLPASSSAATSAPGVAAPASATATTRVVAIVQQRCAPCHAAVPTQPGFNAPPNGVMLDSLEHIMTQRQRMRVQLVSKAMPIGNLTAMTEDERAEVIAWIDQTQ